MRHIVTGSLIVSAIALNVLAYFLLRDEMRLAALGACIAAGNALAAVGWRVKSRRASTS